VNSGFNFIDFEKTSLGDYINACKLGMNVEYDKMAKVIFKGLRK